MNTETSPIGDEREAIDDISIEPCQYEHEADVKCMKCNFLGRVLIWNPKWTVYVHPNYDYIKMHKMRYSKFLDLCPDAIKFITEEIDYICCPECTMCRLHIAHNSRYSLVALQLSLGCHVSD